MLLPKIICYVIYLIKTAQTCHVAYVRHYLSFKVCTCALYCVLGELLPVLSIVLPLTKERSGIACGKKIRIIYIRSIYKCLTYENIFMYVCIFIDFA